MFRIAADPYADKAPIPDGFFPRLRNKLYDNPFNWALIKGSLGFMIGIFAARVISEEFASTS